MSFLYPRLVTITRATAVQPTPGNVIVDSAGLLVVDSSGNVLTVPVDATPAAGLADYQHRDADAETLVASNVPASIQLQRLGNRPLEMLPADTPGKPTWYVFIPLNALPQGAVRTDDTIVDDLGVRYQVAGPYWDSLGHKLLVQILRT